MLLILATPEPDCATNERTKGIKKCKKFNWYTLSISSSHPGDMDCSLHSDKDKWPRFSKCLLRAREEKEAVSRLRPLVLRHIAVFLRERKKQLSQRMKYFSMNNRTSPIAKHEWKVAMRVLHNFLYVINTTAYYFGRYEPYSPSTRELHDRTV